MHSAGSSQRSRGRTPISMSSLRPPGGGRKPWSAIDAAAVHAHVSRDAATVRVEARRRPVHSTTHRTRRRMSAVVLALSLQRGGQEIPLVRSAAVDGRADSSVPGRRGGDVVRDVGARSAGGLFRAPDRRRPGCGDRIFRTARSIHRSRTRRIHARRSRADRLVDRRVARVVAHQHARPCGGAAQLPEAWIPDYRYRGVRRRDRRHRQRFRDGCRTVARRLRRILNTLGDPLSDPLWMPDAERIARARVTAFARLAERRFEQKFPDYRSLYALSIERPGEFWDAVWDFAGIRGDKGDRLVENLERMPGARFF